MADGNGWSVEDYAPETLIRILRERSQASEDTVRAKLHTVYFKEYFEHLSASTIVVEEGYVDRDFLEDFAAYYARCFNTYDRYCSRLHFFTHPFDGDALNRWLAGEAATLTDEVLANSYLGFVVIKPLPTSFVGRTCLKTYSDDRADRFYPSCRVYEANFFGLPLKVETLAFQEQDKTVSACATSAVWSALHGTGTLFQHSLPSPVTITRFATDGASSAGRAFPNSGLTLNEMSRAFGRLGLAPYVYRARDLHALQATLYAYLRAGIPSVLTIKLWEGEPPDDAASDDALAFDYHAVTVTGYRLEGASIPYGASELRLRASRIDRIYVHDDQVGPFARMKIENADESVFTTSWRGEKDTEIGALSATPDHAVVPLYEKIRVSVEWVHEFVARADAMLKVLIIDAKFPEIQDVAKIEWDFWLDTVNALKGEIREQTAPGEARATILASKLPRFLWRIQIRYAGEEKAELLLDATDLEQGPMHVGDFVFDELGSALRAGLVEALRRKQVGLAFEQIARKLKEKEPVLLELR